MTFNLDLFDNRVTFTFDLIFLAQLAAAMDYICTNFSADNSSRFPSRVRTHRETQRSQM